MSAPRSTQDLLALWHRIDSGAALFAAVNRLSLVRTYLIATLALAVICGADYFTRVELMLAPFYAIPCFLVDWRIGRGPALAYALVASGLQWWVEASTQRPYTHAWYLYADVLLNCVFYGVLIWVVAKLRLALEMEQVMSRMDFLTRLANRNTFLEQLEEQLRAQRRTGGVLVVLGVALDRFAAFSQEEGFSTADLALGAVADVVRRSAHKNGLVGRTDHAEFAVAAVQGPGGDPDASLKALASQMNLLMLTRGWRLNYSVACASFDTAPESAHAAMGKLRVLLGEAKQLGRNKSLLRRWTADGQVSGHPAPEAGPFTDFEQTAQMVVDPDKNPWAR